MIQMGKAEPERRPVRASIGLFGERIHGTNHNPFPEDPTLVGLHNRTPNESAKFAEKGRAKEVIFTVGDSNTKPRAPRVELQQWRKPEKTKNGDLNELSYSDVMRELCITKEELNKLKLDVNSALEAKSKAEEAMESSGNRAKSYHDVAEELKKEVDEANEEHMLVELARIEAEKELREIEAQREADAIRFSKDIEMTKAKIRELRRGISRAKELERKLAATNLDVIVLRNEMQLVRAMETSPQKDLSITGADNINENESKSSSLSQSSETELEEAKKELEGIKDNGFRFMTSMDLVREEMMNIVLETERLKRLEKRSNSTVEKLKSKLLQTKSKLESASLAEERAKAILSDLSTALQLTRTEIEDTNKEREAICKEIEATKVEAVKTISHTNLVEEGLQAAMKELESVKCSEQIGANKLRQFSTRAMKTRPSGPLKGSVITISKFEYEYLRQGAAEAQLVAGKKVMAARAWIEALKAGEKEMLIRSEVMKKATRELTDGQELCEAENSLVAEMTVEKEPLNNDEPEPSNSQLMRTPRTSNPENEMPLAARRAKMTRKVPLSPRTRYNPKSPSFTIKRRKAAMPGLVKFLKNPRIEEQD